MQITKECENCKCIFPTNKKDIKKELAFKKGQEHVSDKHVSTKFLNRNLFSLCFFGCKTIDKRRQRTFLANTNFYDKYLECPICNHKNYIELVPPPSRRDEGGWDLHKEKEYEVVKDDYDDE